MCIVIRRVLLKGLIYRNLRGIELSFPCTISPYTKNYNIMKLIFIDTQANFPYHLASEKRLLIPLSD